MNVRGNVVSFGQLLSCNGALILASFIGFCYYLITFSNPSKCLHDQPFLFMVVDQLWNIYMGSFIDGTIHVLFTLFPNLGHPFINF